MASALLVTDDLRHLGAFRLLGKLIRGGLSCRPVPEHYWREASSGDGYRQAVIDCPCGHHPVVELAKFPVACSGCERWFFYAGSEVLALNGPAE